MADDGFGSEATVSRQENRSVAQRLQRSVETHVLVPLAVTIVSAATHYLIRKLPMLIEEQVLPRLREQGRPETAREVVTETAAIVSERVADIVPGLGDGGEGSDDGAAPAKQRQPSNDEREEERRRRAQRRGERRRSLQNA
jgi:hypothetical protein